MPIINKIGYGSIRKYLPSKVVAGVVNSIFPMESWLYDDGRGDPWWQGAAGMPCRWTIQVDVQQTQHGSHMTREPFYYNGLDITPGMWIFSATQAMAVRVVSITSKSSSSVTCVVEDVDRYNTFKNGFSAGVGIFSPPADVIFFELGDDGLPVLDPLPPAASDPAIVSQVEARFRVFNPNTEYRFYQVDHGFSQGSVLKLDPITRKFVNATANDIYIVGTVTSVGPGPNYFYLAPSTKFIPNLEPSLPGTVGSIIWIDPDTGGLTTMPNGSKAPMYIQMNDPVPAYTIGTVDNPVSWDGISFSINKVAITLSGADPISTHDIIQAINAKTDEHGVTAYKSAPANRVVGSVSFPVTAIVDSMEFLVNGEMIVVTAPSITFGESGQIGWWDVVRAINEQTHLHGVYATVDPDMGYVTFANDSGGTIQFDNVKPSSSSVDDGLLNFTDMVGVATNNPPGPATKLKLARPDGGEIIVANIAGDFLADTGLQSASNGSLPLALVVDASIGATNSYVVYDITARDALTELRTGDQVFVQVAEDSEWALYVKTGETWTKIASQDSADSEASTETVEVNVNSASPVLIGNISINTRVTNVTVVVETAFNSENTTLTVGTLESPDLLMGSAVMDLRYVGTYEVDSSYINNSSVGDQNLYVFINKNGATVGQAKVIVSYV